MATLRPSLVGARGVFPAENRRRTLGRKGKTMDLGIHGLDVVGMSRRCERQEGTIVRAIAPSASTSDAVGFFAGLDVEALEVLIEKVGLLSLSLSIFSILISQSLSISTFMYLSLCLWISIYLYLCFGLSSIYQSISTRR